MRALSLPATPFLVTVLLVLSGCVGGGGGPRTTADPTRPTFTDDTGALEGIVLNDEHLPVPGAQVGIRGPESREASTDEQGRFVFATLQPGRYDLFVSALGYSSQTRPVTISPAKVENVPVMLQPVAVAGVPYKVVKGPIPGKFFCGFSALVSGPCKVIGFADPSHPLEQQWSSLSGGEENIFEYRDIHKGNRSNQDDNFSRAIVEVTWRSMSASAQWLQATIEDLPASAGARNLSEPDWNRSAGVSPLRMGLSPGMKSYDGKWVVPSEIKGFLVGVFPVADPSGPKVPSEVPCPSQAPVCLANRTIGVSAYTEQKFEIWITLFYNGDPDPAYTALKDE